jgi:hypothetical protein
VLLIKEGSTVGVVNRRMENQVVNRRMENRVVDRMDDR